jgi:hypothetical protein
LQIEELQQEMGKETRRGRHGRLWLVTIDPFSNGTIKVKVAGDTVAQLLSHIWYNQVVGKRMDPPPSRLFLDQNVMLDCITNITPSQGGSADAEIRS